MHEFDNVTVTYRIGSSGTRYLFLRAEHNKQFEVRSDPHGANHLENVFNNLSDADSYCRMLRDGCPVPVHVVDLTKPSVWFCFDWPDFLRLIHSWDGAACDGYHTVKKFSPAAWMFFDLEGTTRSITKREIMVQTVRIDPQVATLLVRYGRRVFRKFNESSQEYTVELTKERRARWDDRYGQAKGFVKIDIDERVLDLYETRNTDEMLADRIERLVDITRNGTYNKWQTGVLRLSRDGDRSIYFQVHGPDGRRIMNGVVMDHGRGGNVDWSIHT